MAGEDGWFLLREGPPPHQLVLCREGVQGGVATGGDRMAVPVVGRWVCRGGPWGGGATSGLPALWWGDVVVVGLSPFRSLRWDEPGDLRAQGALRLVREDRRCAACLRVVRTPRRRRDRRRGRGGGCGRRGWRAPGRGAPGCSAYHGAGWVRGFAVGAVGWSMAFAALAVELAGEGVAAVSGAAGQALVAIGRRRFMPPVPAEGTRTED